MYHLSCVTSASTFSVPLHYDKTVNECGVIKADCLCSLSFQFFIILPSHCEHLSCLFVFSQSIQSVCLLEKTSCHPAQNVNETPAMRCCHFCSLAISHSFTIWRKTSLQLLAPIPRNRLFLHLLWLLVPAGS